MNRSALVGWCLALLSAATVAEESPFLLRVPLFSPAPPIAATDPIRQIPQTKSRDFVGMRAIVLNEDAFTAGAVTVEIDGKVHTFVGGPRPKQQLPPGYGKDHMTRWAGEEKDEVYGSSTLSLSRDENSGQVIGGFSIRPRRDFAIYSGSPTVLVETVSDWSTPPRAPLWLVIGLVPSLIAVLLAIGWRWSRSPASSALSSSASRLAFANAGIFAMSWMLVFLTALFFKPPSELDSGIYDRAWLFGGLFAVASIGFGLIFWRVRVAYARGNVSILRAPIEGFCGAVVVLLAMEGWDRAIRIYQGRPFPEFLPYGFRYFVEQELPFLLALCVIGAAVGLILWFANRLLWRRFLLPSMR